MRTPRIWIEDAHKDFFSKFLQNLRYDGEYTDFTNNKLAYDVTWESDNVLFLLKDNAEMLDFLDPEGGSQNATLVVVVVVVVVVISSLKIPKAFLVRSAAQ